MPEDNPFAAFGGRLATSPASPPTAAPTTSPVEPAPAAPADPFAAFGGRAAGVAVPAQEVPVTPPSMQATAAGPDPFAAFGGRAEAPAPAPAEEATSEQQPTPSRAPIDDPRKAWYEKAWDWANTPLFGGEDIARTLGREGATGWEKGLYNIIGGQTSPLSAALLLGTFIPSSTLLSFGGAAIKEALGAEEGAAVLAEVVKASKIGEDAMKLGKTASEGIEVAVKAGALNGEKIAQASEILKDAGLSTENVVGGGFIGRGIGSILPRFGMDAMGAAKAGTTVQALVDAKFSIDGLMFAAQASPRFLDALKEGDTQKAEELAIEAIAAVSFGTLRAHAMLKDSHWLFAQTAEDMGLHVKPNAEQQKVRDTFHKHVSVLKEDANKQAQDFEEFGHKELKRLGMDETDAAAAVFAKDHGHSEANLINSYNNMLRAVGRENEVRPLPPEARAAEPKFKLGQPKEILREPTETTPYAETVGGKEKVLEVPIIATKDVSGKDFG